MVAHHTVGGCNLRPGDLLGTGTLSCAARPPLSATACRPCPARRLRLLRPGALPSLLQPARQPGAESRAVSMGTGHEARCPPSPWLPACYGSMIGARRACRRPRAAQRGRWRHPNPLLCARRQGAGGAACLLEATRNGAAPLALGRGLRRAFLEDGDTVRLSAHCQGDGFRVGFGECAGAVLPAHA